MFAAILQFLSAGTAPSWGGEIEAKGNCWLEPLKNFVKAANQARKDGVFGRPERNTRFLPENRLEPVLVQAG